ncbi:MAG TPA: hypothetical protein VKG92_04885 [Flavobacteriales bacterium]|nr:hypothetical protein [Flavobacteriales bacterium]
MKALFIVVLATAALTVPGSAQSLPERGTETTVVMRNDSVVGMVSLNKDQRMRLAEIERRYETRYDQVVANDTLDEAVIRYRLDTLSERRWKEIRQVMTPMQFEQWQRLAQPDHRTGDTP